MSKRRFHIFFILCAALSLLSLKASADGGAYGSMTPYSIFGIGDMTFPGTSYNYGMAGVGIAGRNNKYINILNPAAVTARDSLSFMMDFSGYGENRIFNQESESGTLKSASNVYGIKDCAMTFPIWKSSAMMIGITPMSCMGYDFQSVETGDVIGQTGNITNSITGIGSLNELFVGAGVTFWKRLSIGAEFLFYFGDFERVMSQSFAKTTISDAIKYNNCEVHSFSGRFGLQYEQPISKKSKIIIGATYKMGSDLLGGLQTIKNIDTVLVSFSDIGGVRLASEKGAGLCYKYAEKLSVEFDYTRSDWTDTNIKQSGVTNGFTASLTQSFRLGVEYVPNKNDIRYYSKRIAYRIGGYYKDEYFTFNGLPVYAAGITIGASFPIYRWHNALSFGIDFGQRGSLQNSQVRERYINFAVGINIFDIWFQKAKYE